MLPKSERLTKVDFVGFHPKIVLRGSYFDIAVVPSHGSRFACVISKKRIKRAVDRNKARRKIYNILRETKPRAPHLVIVYPKQTVLTANRTRMQSEMQSLFATL